MNCPYCNHELPSPVYCHNFTTGLFSVLYQAYSFLRNRQKSVNEFHLQKDLNLTKSQYCNAQKIHYWGLIAKVKGKGGYWLITKRGGQFMRGEIVIPAKVWTKDNHLTDQRICKMIHVDEMKRKSKEGGVYFQEDFEFDIEKLERPQQELDFNLEPIIQKKSFDIHDPKVIAKLCQ